MADKRISQLIERTDIANNDVLPIVASGATTTNKVTISTIQEWMQDNLDVGVTSVGITIGSTGTDINVTGSPVTTSGNITINIPTASVTNRGLLSSSDWSNFNSKLSSVGLTMPSAFTVSNSPLTANGTIAVTGAGTVAQYIRGDGSLADFPEAGGGGASVSYYLNGSVSQGTIGGIAYREMNKTPILGAGTDFVAIADGYLASFITDAGDPSLLLIPGGNWNFETYFSASSGGGTPSFYIELYKVDSGGTTTLIASNSAVPELIAFGTTITPYFSTLAVPTTVLTLTDRLALRYYVARSGRTITLHTENSHLCQIITTFTTGLTALNGLTAQVQNFATGTSGTDFNISSTSATHTFNLPDASASNRGAVTTGTQTFAGVKTFNSTITAGAEVQLVQAGTALPTFIKNISGNGLTSSGSNGIGFNNSNNLYLSGSDKGGAVFSINNTGVRTYTFQDNNGTLAFTSDIPTNPVGGTGTTNVLPKFTASSTIGDSAVSDNTNEVSISKRVAISTSTSNFILTPHLSGTTNRIETTGSLPLSLVTAGSSITLAAGGTTPQITLASTGAVTLTGALNGTSATFRNSGVPAIQVIRDLNVTVVGPAGQGIEFGALNGSTPTAGAAIYGSLENPATTGNLVFQTLTAGSLTTKLTISSTGAATFSSSVSVKGGLTIVRSNSSESSIISNEGNLIYNARDNFNHVFQSNGSEVARINTTGAATFSSSVTATSGVFTTGVTLQGAAATSILNTYSVGGTIYGYNGVSGATNSIINGSVLGDLVIRSQNKSILFSTNGGSTSAVTITSTGNVGIGTTSPQTTLSIETSGVQNTISPIITSQSSGTTYTGMYSIRDGAGDQRGLLFQNYTANVGLTEKMRITSGGNVLVGNTVNDFNSRQVNYSTTSYTFHSVRTGTGSEGHLVFSNGNGVVGSIFTSGTSTFYNATSDYRLKEDLQEVKGLEKVEAIKVYDYKWKSDETRMDGVLAHELAEVLPYAVTGEKDEVDENGNDKMQAVDYSKIVPVLIKAIQEQQEQIKSLTEQVEALKSQING